MIVKMVSRAGMKCPALIVPLKQKQGSESADRDSFFLNEREKHVELPRVLHDDTSLEYCFLYSSLNEDIFRTKQ